MWRGPFESREFLGVDAEFFTLFIQRSGVCRDNRSNFENSLVAGDCL